MRMSDHPWSSYLVKRVNSLQVNGHAWFHLYGIWRAMKNGKQSNIQNEKKKPIILCPHRESNKQLLSFQAGALTHWTAMTVIELSFKLVHYFGI